MIRSSSIPNKVYSYVHHSEVYIVTNITGRKFESDWLTVAETGKITVHGSNEQGYAWDGCSPKWNFLQLTWGTPDGRLDYETEKPLTYYASLIHDALYQYKSEGLPISRREADVIFNIILKKREFIWRWLYNLAVRAFGRFYGKWDYNDSVDGVRILECSWRNG